MSRDQDNERAHDYARSARSFASAAAPILEVPELVRSGDYEVVLSISGGKDSTAAALALREAEVPYRMVFADTQWEARETYEHIEYLRTVLGPIDVVGVPGGMVARIEKRAGFPGRMQRWCTRELKLQPLRTYHDEIERTTGRETINVVGIRHAESEARANLVALEDDETWGGWVWRPIIQWTVADVLSIHHKHGITVNSLYKRGHDRVGCYPCIFANKVDIRLVADYAPERIDQIRLLEDACTKERAVRNDAQPGRYSHSIATFFQARERRSDSTGSATIDDVVSWAKTAYGGKQLWLLPPPDSGCFRWGMCEPPSADTTDESRDGSQT